jgi:hypothetical protein
VPEALVRERVGVGRAQPGRDGPVDQPADQAKPEGTRLVREGVRSAEPVRANRRRAGHTGSRARGRGNGRVGGEHRASTGRNREETGPG